MFGRGWFGRGRGFWRYYAPSIAGGRYRYIGPCRCGMGPHAFYEDVSSGRILHAWDLYRMPFATPTDREYLSDRLRELEEERAILEDEIAEIKKRLSEVEKK
ncbi:DUF5320 domain-containing protein [Methanotorris formicicus]|uniref:DUF5320 domain-containing protein n=1 Tax=Methanotorris formicicus Mc-S-70 TaxID=647171 RepID=H1KW46_9EURY|nr:DUF5320 domain-containing protein [Methanotorris formicicus]EHP89629.1 hypothetical protein MetfoDRAFT_0019 [Methanotorris formicicus Mc-S-70]